MGPKPDSDRSIAARGRLTERILRLDAQIDRQQPGSPKRLALLKEQAKLADEREALVSRRV
jgi:hypothetical protein